MNLESSLVLRDDSQEVVTVEELKDNLTAYQVELRRDPSVQALTNKITIDNPQSILKFGEEANKEITMISDRLLNQMKSVKSEESGELIVKLTKLMSKFEPEEFDSIGEERRGLLGKIFGKAKESVEKLLSKYENLGKETDKIFLILKEYEADTIKANQELENMSKSNIKTYETLEKYIVAGEIAKEEVDKYIIEYETKMNENPDDQRIVSTYNNLLTARDMIDQKVYDLRTAENVVLQTVPMIHMMQKGNYNLIRKINSAFIITLPIFKQCLVQAVAMKRQALQAKSLQVLDEKTNELLMRNATATARNSAKLAEMAGTSSIKAETLQATWETIKAGIIETKQIEQANQEERKRNTIMIEQIKKEIKEG